MLEDLYFRGRPELISVENDAGEFLNLGIGKKGKNYFFEISLLRFTGKMPIVVDPSHGTGKLSLVEPMCLAAVAAGADGLMVEVHYDPPTAFSDRDQTMWPDQFFKLVKKLRKMNALMNDFQINDKNQNT